MICRVMGNNNLYNKEAVFSVYSNKERFDILMSESKF